MKRRVVVTGVGLVSSMGQNYSEVVENLRKGKSGIQKVPEWEAHGLKSCIAGVLPDLTSKKEISGISKKFFRLVSDSSLHCLLAAKDALAAAQLNEKDLHNSRTGCIVGTGISGVYPIYKGGELVYRDRRIDRVNPYTVVHSMSNSASAALANVFSIQGRSYSISSACATSAHNIGHVFELIQGGFLDRAMTGGGEEVHLLITSAFEAMRVALSTHYTQTPEKASRPYDAKRDGFVISGGGGILILEAYEEAKRRKAKIYAEILGYAANSDAHDMILPDPEGNQTAECMRNSLQAAGLNPEQIDYINTHGTSTVMGDLSEMKAIRKVFGDKIPFLSSTKSMTGHALGAAAALELIYCIGMLENQFIAPSINIDTIDPHFQGFPIVQTTKPHPLRVVMSNSFGFGGTNAVLIIGTCHD